LWLLRTHHAAPAKPEEKQKMGFTLDQSTIRELAATIAK
jgi:hypothetical protein